MPYNLHIERQTSDGAVHAIALEEWQTAVRTLEGVRLAKGDAAALNPVSAELVTLPNRGGDAELFREDLQTWLRALFWTPAGTVRFKAPESAEDPIVERARQLAHKLDARIYNEKGETYD